MPHHRGGVLLARPRGAGGARRDSFAPSRALAHDSASVCVCVCVCVARRGGGQRGSSTERLSEIAGKNVSTVPGISDRARSR